MSSCFLSGSFLFEHASLDLFCLNMHFVFEVFSYFCLRPLADGAVGWQLLLCDILSVQLSIYA